MADYRDLQGKTVRLTEERRSQAGPPIPAGTIGTATDRSNAGFRGLEWRFTAPNGLYAWGVPGGVLELLG